jgi:hypothetical protein
MGGKETIPGPGETRQGLAIVHARCCKPQGGRDRGSGAQGETIAVRSLRAQVRPRPRTFKGWPLERATRRPK